ncbi:WD40-repeat-containing domain protein [Suillus subalutaceus]|uniref:WD40-repeat-containing domain protein n=1 Tax=Suillus subalutaceus TaxID=48586 RepID=UPI001B86AEA2|nr:WD40-repeat-containing domain protein [Suillus subalutaceus]KAG1855208.1 WD40-repeat-containing domain protein [Suillus subalutaceus]
MSSSASETPAIMPRQTMRGHTGQVHGVVHLPDGRRIITGSSDGSLRLWDLKSGAQIGEEWQDGNNGVRFMALSPNGKTITSGSSDYSVRLWDIETRKVISKWTGHTNVVFTLCWSADGERVASGSWDVDSGKTILTIKTGHKWVWAVIYSPDSSKLATGGDGEVCSKNLGCKDRSSTMLEGHGIGSVDVISLSQNNRFLASVSWDKTARLWNLDTNLPVGPPLKHEDFLHCAALSTDGKVLVTACKNGNAYKWDVHAILKTSGLEDLLPSIPNVPTRKSLMNSNATQHPPIQARRLPQNFFDGVQNGAQSSAVRGTHSRSPAQYPRSTRAFLLERWSSLFRHSPSDADGAIALQQRPRGSIFSRGPPIVEVPTVQDRKALYVARPAQNTQQQTQSHGQGSPTAPPVPGTNTVTPDARPARSRLVRLLAHLVLFLCCASPQHTGGNSHPTQQQPQGQAQTHATSSQTQNQQGQSQGQSQAQASSSQTQPAAPSTSATPTALNAHTTAPAAHSGQPRPLPLRTRFVLFLCCASLPHTDGH